MLEHPKTWWFRTAEKLFPNRCREIPEAKSTQLDGEMPILIRQFSVIKGHVYLQQFASGECEKFMHSHPWAAGTIAIGLWGNLRERRIAGRQVEKRYKAPYFRYMGPNFVHQTTDPSPGHTSIFIGLGKKTDDKFYFDVCDRVHWTDHIKKLVARL